MRRSPTRSAAFLEKLRPLRSRVDWRLTTKEARSLVTTRGRRHFASELRHAPLRDLCDLGGWKNPQMLTCYQRPSEEAQRAALETRKVLHG
jgi:hypothetical protein